MEDLAGLQVHMAWDHLESLYKAGADKVRDAKRSILVGLRGNEPFRRTAKLKDELLAHIRWSSRGIQGDMRVPIPVDWDSRHVVALLEFARVINDYMHQHKIHVSLEQGHDSSSSSSIMPALPPISMALVLANLFIFFKPGGVLLRNVSLSPYCVVDRKEYRRLLTAAFVHVDATHLITNLTAALPECLMLEDTEGSSLLLGDLLLLTLLSHGLYVGFAWLQKEFFIKRHNYYQVITVGCSGVVFALKVWAGHRRGGYISVWGLPIPSEFAWVPSLAFTHLCVPEASFPAHLCGVLAGLIRAYCVQPAAAVVAGVWHWWTRGRRGAAQGGHLLGQATLGSQRSQQQQQLGPHHSQADGGLASWRQQQQQLWQQERNSENGQHAGLGEQQQVGGVPRQGSGGWFGGGLRPGSSSRVWRNLSIHLGFATAAAAIYLLTSSTSSRATSRTAPLPWKR